MSISHSQKINDSWILQSNAHHCAFGVVIMLRAWHGVTLNIIKFCLNTVKYTGDSNSKTFCKWCAYVP